MADLRLDHEEQLRAAADAHAIAAFVGFEFLWNLGCGMFSLSLVSAFVVALQGPMTVAGLVPSLGGIISLLAQPLAMLFFGKVRDRRWASVAMLHGMTWCFLLLGIAIFVLSPAVLRAHLVPLTVALSALGLLFGSLNAPLYYSLAIDAVSPQQLGRLTGLRQVGNAAGNLAAAALVAWMLTSTAQPFNYGRALVIGGILGLLGSTSLLLMPKPFNALADSGAERSSAHLLGDTLRALWRERSFRTLLGGLWLAAVITGAAGMGVGYLRRAAGNDGVVGQVIIVSAVARLLSGPVCGWLATRCGMRIGAVISLGASCVGFVGLALLPPTPAAVLWGIVIGLTLATMEMWSYILPAHMFPHVNRVNLVAILGTLTGPIMFGAPVLLGRLFDVKIASPHLLLPIAALALLTLCYFLLFVPNTRLPGEA